MDGSFKVLSLQNIFCKLFAFSPCARFFNGFTVSKGKIHFNMFLGYFPKMYKHFFSTSNVWECWFHCLCQNTFGSWTYLFPTKFILKLFTEVELDRGRIKDFTKHFKMFYKCINSPQSSRDLGHKKHVQKRKVNIVKFIKVFLCVYYVLALSHLMLKM